MKKKTFEFLKMLNFPKFQKQRLSTHSRNFI